MTNGHRSVGEDDLTANIDDELSPERRALVEAWLADHPQARARVARDREIAARLRAALEPLADAPAPEHLRLDAIRRDMRGRRLAGARKLAAAVALVALGAGAGWGLSEFARRGGGNASRSVS